jgi:hypothetical protein
MPDLYLVWGGIAPYTLPWGMQCSTWPPNFNQPQIDLSSNGIMYADFTSGASMLPLSDRILLINATQDSVFLGGHNDFMRAAYCQSWPRWSQIGSPSNNYVFPASASNGNPALANWGTGALAVWNGVGDDTRIWCSQYDQSQNAWGPQYLTKLEGSGAPIQAGAAPAIATLNGVIYMVWRGEGSNDSLYWAQSTDGLTWVGNHQITGAASSNQPALVIFNGFPVLCFKGAGNDGGIYTATFNVNDSQWTPVYQTGPFGTSFGPTLAVYQGQLFMAWKGAGSDTSLWWATTPNNLDKNAWSGQQSIPGVGSSAQPAAVVY